MPDGSAPGVQAETLGLTFDECQLSGQALQDLAEALRLSLRLRRLTLFDVLPSMLSMTSNLHGLEELSLIDICGNNTDLGPPLEVGIYPCPAPASVSGSSHTFYLARQLHSSMQIEWQAAAI